MKSRQPSSLSVLAVALASALASHAQAQSNDTEQQQSSRVTASSTSNTTSAYDTKRVQELDKVSVTGNKNAYVLGGGNMTVQTASKAISTVTRESISQASGGSNFTQVIDAIPGVDASTSDVTGLNNGNYSLRGFDSSAIGITVNGAPVTDSGSYSVYATEYGDAENYNDITVMQGTPNVDQPEMGATGGQIAWSTVDPTHDFGVDFNQGFGSNDYRRSFIRVNTGDTGPVRSWVSFSRNTADKWKGKGTMDVNKIDGKSLWEISPGNSISASFQYNRQSNYSYQTGSKAQLANDYEYDYADDWGTGSTSYYKLRRNPYKSLLASLDGEFTLSDSLRLSVVPYVWWGQGGGSSATTIRPSTSSANVYGRSGSVADASDYAYTYSYSSTVRPGIVAKFFQDIGLDHNLVYGLWFDRSRKSQNSSSVAVDQSTGEPCDVWADTDSCFITYPDGSVQQSYRTYTVTNVQKYFVQDNWTPTDDWALNLGLSWIHATRKGHNYQWPGSTQEIGVEFDNSYSKLLPAFGVKYSPDSRNQFFYGVAKTFRVPATNSITLNMSADQAIPEPESAWTNDIGWRFYGDRLAVSSMLYQSNYENKQMSSYDQNTALTTYVSIPKVRMRGFNTEASYAFTDSLKLYGSYTYTQAKILSDTLAVGTSSGVYEYAVGGKQLANTPKNIANLRLSYNYGNFWATLKGRYSGSRYGDYMNTERVGGYTTFGIDTGYTFNDWAWLKKPSIKLNLYNLTDKRAITWANTTQVLAASGASEYPDVAPTGTPYYSVLESRAFAVTFGASF
ncbi:TonB-dependent receptor [[Pseudomonas] boreopolis]|uniref:TonB-dependent receptor n=1 Tax=Xanthomonas boreopolis TaxID=86183 RepID=UPI003D519A8E